MTCKNCNKRIPNDTEICPRCGAPQKETVSLGATVRAAHAKKNRKGWSSLTTTQKTLSIIAIVLASLLALLVAGVLVIYITIATNIQHGSDLSGDLQINQALPPSEDVRNIALFGLDNRTDSTDGRSDAIIILSIDKVHNQIKMTSVARDTLVPVDGYPSYDGKTKLTHAFKQGGVNLAVKTLNKNFGMNIQDYVYVNFREFIDLIDYIGGVELEVEQRELQELNNHIYYMEIECKRDIDRVKSAGRQTLSGGQALAFARIRKIDSDIARGDRQKEVLQAAFAKIKDLSITKYPGLIAEGLGMCHTNLSSSDILSLATWAVTSSPEFVNFSLPSEECKAWGGDDGGHGWVWIYDLEYATSLLHNFIYEEALGTTLSPSTTYIPKRTTTTTTAATSTTAPTGGTTSGGSSTEITSTTEDSTTSTDLPVDGPTDTTEDTTETTGDTTDTTGDVTDTTGDTTETTGDVTDTTGDTTEDSTTSTEGADTTDETSTTTTLEAAA